MVATLSKKLVEARGQINRTHGGDTYDHHKLRKALRRHDRETIQEYWNDEAQRDIENQAYEMDQYYRALKDKDREDTWQEMDAYEAATGVKFVCEAHYHQHLIYHQHLPYLS